MILQWPKWIKQTGKFDPLYIVLTLGETENEVEDSENYHDNDLDDYYLDKYDNGEYESLETHKQFSNEKEESEKVDYTYYLCKVRDCGKFYKIAESFYNVNYGLHLLHQKLVRYTEIIWQTFDVIIDNR